MKKQILILLLILNGVFSFAQTTFQLANKAYSYKEYNKAINLYKKALKIESSNENIQSIHFNMAESFRNINLYQDALTSYKNAMQSGLKNTETLRGYQQCLLLTGNYSEASLQLEEYVKLNSSDELANMLLKSVQFASKNETDVSVNVKNEKTINSPNSDFAPAIVYDKILFTSTRPGNYRKTWNYTGQNFSDFYEVKCNNTKELNLKNPSLIEGVINTEFNDGTITCNPITNEIYYMQCNGIDGTQENCLIYATYYDKKKKTWDKIRKINLGPNGFSYGHPALSPDGNMLYFTSDMKGSLGGKDIWRAQKENGTWAKAENLGPTINTIGDECYPFLIGDTLCFSSNGLPGYGGLDIFISKLNNNIPETPQNLRQPINSNTDDFAALFFNDYSGMFSSNRPNGAGDDDIYSFVYIRINATGTITDTSGLPIDSAEVTLYINDSIKYITMTDSLGIYNFKTLKQDESYKVKVVKKGFYQDSLLFNTNNIKTSILMSKASGYNLDLSIRDSVIVPAIDSTAIRQQQDSAALAGANTPKIKLVKENERVRKVIVYYAFSKWNVYKTNKPELDYVVKYMKNHPDEKVLLDSHTDERSSDEFNMRLSKKRSIDVIQYMVKNGIDSNRIAYKAWGESSPVVKLAKTEKDHQLNRRTEFTFMLDDEFAQTITSGQYIAAQTYFGPEDLGNTTVTTSASTPETATISNSATTPINPVSTLRPRQKNKNKVSFSVQFASYKEKVDPSVYQSIVDKFPDQEIHIVKNQNDETYKYNIGVFASFDHALELVTKLREYGFPCFITAYYKNKRISVPEAKRLANE